MQRKGIVLAAGAGTRLYPITTALSKQLLPVYDKPMIYYPVSVLMQAGIRDILIITAPQDLAQFKKLLGDGRNWGICLHYAVQRVLRGIGDAFIIGRSFIGNSPSALALGDNIFYGKGLETLLRRANERTEGGSVFACQVRNPKDYGVIAFDRQSRATSLEEKPKKPKSNYAVTGLYFYDNQVVDIAAQLSPSKRGELEITDINRVYLKKNKLCVEMMRRGYTWFDMGNFTGLAKASNFIQKIEQRQGIKISCPEEVAYRKKFIGAKQLKKLAVPLSKSGYGEYLLQLLQEDQRQ